MHTVNSEHILEQLRARSLDSVVQEQHGDVAVRLFRMLREKGFLEQQHASQLALVNEKTCRQHLYALYRSKYITLQEVPKRSDHAPATTIYLYGVVRGPACRLALPPRAAIL